VKKVDQGSATIYVGSYYELEAGTGAETKYYYFGGQRVTVRRGGVLHYLHGDHGSSPKGELLGSLAQPNCAWAPPLWPRTEPVARR